MLDFEAKVKIFYWIRKIHIKTRRTQNALF